MDEIVEKINAFQPELLSGYPSMIKLLARQQTEGRLKISPKKVITYSEAQTEDVKAAISRAWDVRPFNWYVATETGAIGSDCPEHRGIHFYDDLVIPEFVDENNQPVSPGQYSSKVLVTVLFTRTLPLIRYQLEDSICLSKQTCPCGRQFSIVENIQGRIQQVIYLTGKSGKPVAIQPLFWKGLMEKVPCDGWQIIQKTRESLALAILHPETRFNETNLKQRLFSELFKQGAIKPSIEFEYPSSLERTSMGKVALIRALE